LWVATLIVASDTLGADEHGHSHDAPAQAAGHALPRFAATSEAFELVGVVNGKHLTLYLDRAPDNSPVNGAQLQLELSGAKVDVKPHGEGEFEATLAQELKPGVIPVTATVIVGNESDLLAGDLDLHASTSESGSSRSWRDYVIWVAAGIASLVLLLIARRWLRRRSGQRVAL
jgi:hypothetical protein